MHAADMLTKLVTCDKFKNYLDLLDVTKCEGGALPSANDVTMM